MASKTPIPKEDALQDLAQEQAAVDSILDVRNARQILRDDYVHGGVTVFCFPEYGMFPATARLFINVPVPGKIMAEAMKGQDAYSKHPHYPGVWVSEPMHYATISKAIRDSTQKLKYTSSTFAYLSGLTGPGLIGSTIRSEVRVVGLDEVSSVCVVAGEIHAPYEEGHVW